MRIITGTAKGTKLKTPRGLAVRPTADRVKESIFNILGGRVIDANVLDLFAGTGNLGLESLSRGAGHATFVDQSHSSISLIKQNAIQTKLQDQLSIIKGNVLTVLDKALVGQHYDLIFCDPPYNKGLVALVLSKVDQLALLESGGIVIAEHSEHESVGSQWQNLQLRRVEHFGETCISFFVRV